MKMGKDGFYNKCIKRCIDVICALLAMIVFSWLYIIIAILVRINLGSPVIFRQERPGRINSKTGKATVFYLYKFRSMTDAKDADGNLLPDKERLTKFGRILRSTSLDELPEAWNILKGDMSIVGPRPLLVKYLDYYNSHDARRHEVRPGLTGLAQINGRNSLTWGEKFGHDVEYVEKVSLLMDIRIVLKTVKNVICREGIEFKDGHEPVMEYFEKSREL